MTARGFRMPARVLLWCGAAVLLAAALWQAVPEAGSTDAAPPLLVLWLIGVALFAITNVRQVAALDGHPAHGTLAAALFGLWVLYFWQVGVTLFNVPRVLLPAPGWIGQMLVDRWDTLAGDWVQTVAKAVLVGWALEIGRAHV